MNIVGTTIRWINSFLIITVVWVSNKRSRRVKGDKVSVLILNQLWWASQRGGYIFFLKMPSTGVSNKIPWNVECEKLNASILNKLWRTSRCGRLIILNNTFSCSESRKINVIPFTAFLPIWYHSLLD